MDWELQVDTDKGTTRVLGSTEEGYRDAVAMRDSWRSQPPEGRYVLTDSGGATQVAVRDIRDVRVVAS